jgi:hypothetical protein
MHWVMEQKLGICDTGSCIEANVQAPLLQISRINMLVAASFGKIELSTLPDPSTREGTLSNNNESCGKENSSDSEEKNNVEG